MSKNKNNLIKETAQDHIFDAIGLIIITVACLLIIYPLLYVIACSFSSGRAILTNKVFIWPVEFNLEGYKMIFQDPKITTGFYNSFYYTIVGTILSVIVTTLAAYPLSRTDLAGRKWFTIYFTIPMFIGGGMIPTYLLISNLGLLNTRGAIILPAALSIYNMIVMRTFFQNTLSRELLEAAQIDGCSNFGFLFRIAAPLSKAIFAVMALYYGVAQWNSYFPALLYLSDSSKYPLQTVLREILLNSQVDMSTLTPEQRLQFQSVNNIDSIVKYSSIVVATIPTLIVYPFVQKHFVKGVMIGSVKG